jgi:arylsulfatase A-like enzyme
VTLAEALRYAGYHTSLLTDEPYPERVNLEQGFEEVVNTSAMGSPVPSAPFAQAAGQADEGLDRPFFLCLHTHRLTQTVAKVLLEPPMNLDRLREKLHARYFGELEVLDQQLGEFLASLESHGRLADTFLIVTADHGIDLSDRYPTIIPAGTGFTLHDEQLHVPLFMRAPAGLLAPRQVPAQVRLIDLAPTVCDLLGVPLPADRAPTQWAGESLAPLPRQGADLADRPVFASACFLLPERAAVRWRGYKYIRVLNPKEPRGEPFLEPLDDEQLYNMSTDPGETENLAAKEPPLLTEMRAFLLAHLEEGARQRLALFPEAAPQPAPPGRAAPSAEAAEKVSPASAAKGGERR